ncbi:MAG: ubiquinol-cytochrome c reductase iron-sulfur subunit [Anaerolineae bacterium]
MREDHHAPEEGTASQKGFRFDRRSFLSLVAKGSVAAAVTGVVAQVIRFLSFQPPASESSIVPLGQPDAYPQHSLVYIAEARVYVGHDAGGLYALDAVCTHLGCLVEPHEDGGFICPCHDSLFDPEGRALSGPATRPLQHLHLCFDQEQGQLLVDRAEPVEAAVRLVI